VQKYLETHDAPAAVLVASVPPQGVATSLLRFTASQIRTMARHPWRSAGALLAGKPLPAFEVSEALVREVFFCSLTPDGVVRRCMERLEMKMSARALLDMTILNLPKPHLVTTPALVLGAQYDLGVAARELHATARAFNTEAVVFADMGHDMMLEPGWQAVAEWIAAWLCDQGL
jgi:hypothetical protein